MTGVARKTERMSSFKKGIDAKDGRRRRDDTRIQLRKNKREEHLMKRRATAAVGGTGANDASINTTDPSSAGTASSLMGTTGSSSGGTPTKIYTVQDIPQLLAGITTYSSMSDPTILESIRGFRRMLSVERSPPCKEVIECGALPHFVFLLEQHESVDIQFEAAWALTNVASSDYTASVANCGGAIPILVKLLRSGDPNVREQCAWCLGNIAGDGTDLRDAVLSAGALEGVLLNIAQPANTSLLSNVAWTLSNFCRGKPQPELHVVSPALPHLSSLLHNVSTPKDVLVDVAWALSYLSDIDDHRIQACQDANVTGRLVELLVSDQANLITPCLRTLGNFVSGSDVHTQAVLDASILDKVGPLLGHPRKNIRKETCWLLSNVAAGTHPQISSLLSRADVVMAVVSALNSDQWEVRKEAAWVVSNICTGGTAHHIEKIVEMGAIESLCNILDVADSKIVTVVLEAIECLLKAGEALNKSLTYVSFIDEADGIDKIENLQEHEDDEIYEKAVCIIEKYFGCDDAQEDENLAPVISGDTFSFGVPTKAVEGDSSEQPKLAPFNFASGDEMQFNFAS